MRVKLGDVAVERREKCKTEKDDLPSVGLEHLISEHARLKLWDEESKNTFTRMFHKGDVLFGRIRAYLKKAAFAEIDGICSGDIIVINAKPDVILPELLPFAIQNDAFFNFAVVRSAGTVFPRVKWQDLKEYEFELPDMNTQKKLADVLWAINDTIEAYMELMSATDDMITARYVEMFGNPTTNPFGYPVVRLKDVAVGSLSYGSGASADDYDGETRYVRITDINDDGSLGNDIKSPSEIDNKYLLHEGDVLFARTGSVGRTFRYRKTKHGRCIYAGYLIRVTPNTEIINPDYLFHFTKTKYYWNFVNITKRVVCQPNINAREYGNLKLLLPDMHIQNQFAEFARQAEESKSHLGQALLKLKLLSKKIIRKHLNAKQEYNS